MPKYQIVLTKEGGVPSFFMTIEALEVRELKGGPVVDNLGDEMMTPPQKRYLFRLLAAQGIEGKQAEAHLTEYFKVTSLAEVPKAAASGYIDQLVKAGKGVSGDGKP